MRQEEPFEENETFVSNYRKKNRDPERSLQNTEHEHNRARATSEARNKQK